MTHSRQHIAIPADDAEAIIALWQSVFGDSREMVVEYLTRFATTHNYMLARNDSGRAIGMIHFPTLIDVDGTSYRYLYALAVAPEYRSQGVARYLVDNLINRSDGIPIATIPADESLRRWYAEKFGFRYPEKPLKIFHDVDFDLGTGTPEDDIFMIKL